MMTGISALQADLAQWEKELASLEDECTAEGWTEPEKLLFTLQLTASTYRQRILPRITADRALVLPAVSDSDAAETLAAYCAIVADELLQLVDKLDELRIELVRSGHTAELQLQSVGALAGIGILSKVIRRLRHVDRAAVRARP